MHVLSRAGRAGALLFAALFAALVVGAGTARALAGGPPVGVDPVYLALGDSAAVGVGASDPATTAYVPLYYAYLRTALDPGRDSEPLGLPDAATAKRLQLDNLAVGGATTTSMIEDGQLATAVATLQARNGNARPVDDVRVVTVSIGGNDARTVIADCAGGLSPTCAQSVATMLATLSANMPQILAQLRAAAGPDTPIVAMTYYNALLNPSCPLHASAPLADAILEGNAALGLPAGVNDIIRAAAAAQGVLVANTYGAIGPSDLQPDCTHLNDAGYAKAAAAFEEAYGAP